MREYELLMFSFSGSQIFFTDDADRGTDNDMKGGGGGEAAPAEGAGEGEGAAA